MGAIKNAHQVLTVAWLTMLGESTIQGYDGTLTRPSMQPRGGRNDDRNSMGRGGLRDLSLRKLQECPETEGLFVNSALSDLGHPIGGCYAALLNRTFNYPMYVRGGGELEEDKSVIYVSSDASAVSSISDFGDSLYWSIGMLENDGGGLAPSVTCSATGGSADSVTGPTDSSLFGTWKCVVFVDGTTRYDEVDFEEVQCGCGGPELTDAGDGDDDDDGDDLLMIILIAVVAGAAVLLALYFLWTFRKRGSRAQKQREQETQEQEAPSTTVRDSKEEA